MKWHVGGGAGRLGVPTEADLWALREKLNGGDPVTVYRIGNRLIFSHMPPVPAVVYPERVDNDDLRNDTR